MTIVSRAQVQFLAAIAAGFAGCHRETSAVTIEPPQPVTTGTSTTVATATETQTATAATNTAAAPSSKCPDYAKAERLCVPPRTPPSNGGNIAPPANYSAWDKNGCYQPSEIQGACNGIVSAHGPHFKDGKCCFDVCQGTPAPCGRPLLVAGQPRVAAVVARADWSASPMDLGAHGALRGRAARAWRDDAALEHASIASFARLSLELLALGAPSDLVAAAHQAALEEIEHARVCFGIAAELEGAPAALGPAPLAMDGVAVRTDLASIARDAAAESCVGETIAALALARAAKLCDSGELVRRLTKMADDELGHAALGWQLVAWAWARGDDAVRAGILAALTVPDYDAPAFGDASEAAEWHALGRLTRADMAVVVRDARALVQQASGWLEADYNNVALAASSARERIPSLRNTLCS